MCITFVAFARCTRRTGEAGGAAEAVWADTQLAVGQEFSPVRTAIVLGAPWLAPELVQAGQDTGFVATPGSATIRRCRARADKGSHGPKGMAGAPLAIGRRPHQKRGSLGPAGMDGRLPQRRRRKHAFRVELGKSILDGRHAWDLVPEEHLGNGTFGSVWKARMTLPCGFDEQVAVKIYNMSTVPRQKLLREINMLKLFSGGSFLTYYGWWTAGDHVMIIMELAHADMGPEVLKRSFESVGLLERVRHMKDLMQGLRAMHRQGYMHRDIKHRNVMLVRSQNGLSRVKIADFGEACSFRVTTRALTLLARKTERFVGTPSGMAPECWRREGCPKSDVFAAGTLFYMLLFEGSRIESIDSAWREHGKKKLPEFGATMQTFDIRSDRRFAVARSLARSSDDPLGLSLLALLEKMLQTDCHQRIDSSSAYRELVRILLRDSRPHETEALLREAKKSALA